MPTALITGITGQDGRYLASQLRERGYRVIGLARRPSDDPMLLGVEVLSADVRDRAALSTVLAQCTPDEIYHLAADSSVHRSWDEPELAEQGVLDGTASVIEGWRADAPLARLLVASSCEVFGGTSVSPQDEATPLVASSPYGRGKVRALELVRRIRQESDGHVSAAILYNHESPLRSPAFLSRRVSMAVAGIAAGSPDPLVLGSLTSRRDWGFAGDYTQAMWRMLQQPLGDDFVIGTGVTHSVEELCAVAFAAAGLDWRRHVVSDPARVRRVDSTHLVANPAAARDRLGWVATTSFEAMIGAMVAADIERLKGPVA
jgi:GDPmannose 4,6-dehydratase